jgi:hypothetical protein
LIHRGFGRTGETERLPQSSTFWIADRPLSVSEVSQ